MLTLALAATAAPVALPARALARPAPGLAPADRYFGHTDPAGITFQDRMRAAHWATPYVAENIAFDRDERHANAAFVNSPGHYANMIDPNERRVGVAVITVGRGETFYVQVFSGI